MTNTFILIGFIDHPELTTWMLVYSVLYETTVKMNLGFVALFLTHCQLGTLIFLGNIALVVHVVPLKNIGKLLF